ncbi:hypothetical protein OBP_076 [Pseudomonas phage OBP]|uniref:hypothetical protein n=1 Tax=Pseudomonas phage OBP TaxID=1124849 RepID=UPI000240D42A|nr:hypothetical protein OBP_076 [Pseudomonas phage OBP]AEV89513.1 hypothetical protein OBP_076 [Pseudomonas phage OBP]
MAKRLQVDVSDETFDKLSVIKDKTNASQGEVVSKAIKLYSHIMNALNDDGSLTYLNVNGKEVKLIIL